jgi:hypothetical protein
MRALTALAFTSPELFQRTKRVFERENIKVTLRLAAVNSEGVSQIPDDLYTYDLLIVDIQSFLDLKDRDRLRHQRRVLRSLRQPAPEVPTIGLTRETAPTSADPHAEYLSDLDGYLSVEHLLSHHFSAKQWEGIVLLAQRKRKEMLADPTRDVGRHDVFICHAGEDKQDVVEPLVKALEEFDISCWYDKNEIRWGDRIVEKVNTGLKNARYVLVVLSKDSIHKSWPKTELESAIQSEITGGKKRILPLIVGDERTKQTILNEIPLIRNKRYLMWSGDAKSIAGELFNLLC